MYSKSLVNPQSRTPLCPGPFALKTDDILFLNAVRSQINGGPLGVVIVLDPDCLRGVIQRMGEYSPSNPANGIWVWVLSGVFFGWIPSVETRGGVRGGLSIGGGMEDLGGGQCAGGDGAVCGIWRPSFSGRCPPLPSAAGSPCPRPYNPPGMNVGRGWGRPAWPPAFSGSASGHPITIFLWVPTLWHEKSPGGT